MSRWIQWQFLTFLLLFSISTAQKSKKQLFIKPTATDRVTDNNIVTQDKAHCVNKNSTKGLETCVKTIKKRLDIGILENLKSIEETCRFFNSEGKCVTRWLRQCISTAVNKEQLNSSMATAGLKFYQYLCNNDQEFKADLRRNENCLTKTSIRWSECIRNFDDVLQEISQFPQRGRSICCVRIRFILCMKSIGENLCPGEVPFFEKFALILVRTEEESSSYDDDPYQCEGVSNETCKRRSMIGSAFSIKRYQMLLLHIIAFLFLLPFNHPL